jgi:hypothetical protein
MTYATSAAKSLSLLSRSLLLMDERQGARCAWWWQKVAARLHSAMGYSLQVALSSIGTGESGLGVFVRGTIPVRTTSSHPIFRSCFH